MLVTQRLGDTVQTTAVLEGPDNYVTPAGSDSELSYRIQARLTRNGAQQGSPYVYDIAKAYRGIPMNPALSVRTKDLATVQTLYAAEGGAGCVGTHAGVDWGTGLSVLPYAGIGTVPTTRTQYFTPKLNWTTDVGITSSDCRWDSANVSSRTENFPRPGMYSRIWNNAPFGPAAGWLHWQTASEPALVVRMLSQPDAVSQIAPYAHMTGTSTLRNACTAPKLTTTC